MSSVILRGTSASARHEECEAITGADDVSSASKNVLSETCEMSTIIPSRFISRTTCLPKSVSPLCSGGWPELSAHGVLLGVRQRHVAGAQCKKGAQDGQVGIDRLPAFHAHQHGDVPALACGQNFVGGGCQFQVRGMARGLAPHGVDLIERPPDGLGGRVAVGIGPDRQEQAGDVTGAHARDVDLPEVVLLRQIVALVEDHLGGVVVQVDDHRPLEQAGDTRGIDLGLAECGERDRQQKSELEHDDRIIADGGDPSKIAIRYGCRSRIR